jgi:hypothetical protein
MNGLGRVPDTAPEQGGQLPGEKLPGRETARTDVLAMGGPAPASAALPLKAGGFTVIVPE